MVIAPMLGLDFCGGNSSTGGILRTGRLSVRWLMRLFLYGTLLGDRRLGVGTPATLTGWRRVVLRGTRYPTLRRDRSGAVSGAVVKVPAPVLRRLIAYEGPAYRLVRVVVQTASGKTAAYAWIAPGGTRRPWRE